jgi:pimeloyl-ACP methyl ester carboxylesterase
MGLKKNEAGHEQVFEALFSIVPSKLASRREADEIMSRTVEELSVRQFLLNNLARTTSGSFEWKFNLDAIYKNYEYIITAIESDKAFGQPALFIRGGKSDYIKNEDWIAIKEHFTEAELVTVANAGHWVHADATDVFLENVMEFINRA